MYICLKISTNLSTFHVQNKVYYYKLTKIKSFHTYPLKASKPVWLSNLLTIGWEKRENMYLQIKALGYIMRSFSTENIIKGEINSNYSATDNKSSIHCSCSTAH